MRDGAAVLTFDDAFIQEKIMIASHNKSLELTCLRVDLQLCVDARLVNERMKNIQHRVHVPHL